MRTLAPLALFLGALASAEPVVATFPEQTFNIDLQDIDARFPAARFYALNADDGNPSAYASFPGIVELDGNGEPLPSGPMQIEGPEDGPLDNGYWPAGVNIPADIAPDAWVQATGYFAEPPLIPTLAFFSADSLKFCGDFGCELPPVVTFFIPNDALDDPLIEIYNRSEAFYLPLRQFDSNDAIRFGWGAYRLVEYRVVCPAEDLCDGTELAAVELLAVGFETEPDTPIAVGGGACLTDLNLDGVLDLADLQSFVTGFVNQTDDGDLTGDGIYDLDDVQAFVADFNDCQLL